MAVRVMLVLAVIAVLCGCGQANAPVEKKEKKAGVEQVAKPQKDKAGVEETTNTSNEKCDPDLPAYKQGSACAGGMEAAADALNEPLTVETMNEMYNGIRARAGGEEADRFSGALLNCQLTKYAQEHGQKAAEDHAADLVIAVIDGETDHDTVQAELIDEGYTCSMSEVNNQGY